MTDLSYLDPPIEVAAESPRLEMILARLRAGRMRPYRAAFPVEHDCPEPLLIDVKSGKHALLAGFIPGADAPSTRPLIILGEHPEGIAIQGALVVARDKDLSILRGRLAALARRTARRTEFRLRRETAASLGIELFSVEAEMVPELLYLGDGSARFLSLQAALNERGVAVTAALSARTAADYLKHRTFSSVLFDVTNDTHVRPALRQWISSGDPLLADVPLFALVESLDRMSLSDHEMLSLTSEILEHSASPAGLAERIDGLSRRHVSSGPGDGSRQWPATLVDPSSGIHTRMFFEAHLARQMTHSADRAEPLSLLVLKHSGESGLHPHERDVIAGLLRASLRDTDMPAHIEPDAFAVSMPATPYRGAVSVSERFFRTIERRDPSLAKTLGWRIIEKRSYHSVRTLLGAACTGVFQKLRVA